MNFVSKISLTLRQICFILFSGKDDIYNYKKIAVLAYLHSRCSKLAIRVTLCRPYIVLLGCECLAFLLDSSQVVSRIILLWKNFRETFIIVFVYMGSQQSLDLTWTSFNLCHVKSKCQKAVHVSIVKITYEVYFVQVWTEQSGCSQHYCISNYIPDMKMITFSENTC